MASTLTTLRNQKGFKKYLKNTSWLIAEKALRMIVGLFVGIWIARYLGPAKFGLLSYAFSFVGLFIYISSLGLDGIVIRELVKEPNRRDVLLGTAFLLKAVGAVMIIVVLIVVLSFTPDDRYTAALIFIIASATIFQSFNVIDFYFQSKVLGKYAVFANAGSLLAAALVKVALILMQAPLIAFAWVVLFESLILALGYVYFYYVNDLSIKSWRFSRAVATSLLAACWPLMLGGLAISVYMRIDQLMIKAMLGNESVGQYAAAVRLSEAWYLIPMVITASLYPSIINSKKRGLAFYRQRVQKLFTLMVWLALAIALPTALLADWIVAVLYGSEYFAAGRVLMIHIWSGVFVFLGVASGKILVAEHLEIIELYRSLFGMFTNVGLNLLLIPKYGIVGAALATLLAQVVAAYLFDLFHPRTRTLFYLKSQALFPFGPLYNRK